MSKGKKPTYDAPEVIGKQTAANQDAWKANVGAAQKSSPWGQSVAKYDANGNPIGFDTSFSGPMQGAANNVMGNYYGATQFLPNSPATLAGAMSPQNVNAYWGGGWGQSNPSLPPQPPATSGPATPGPQMPVSAPGKPLPGASQPQPSWLPQSAGMGPETFKQSPPATGSTDKGMLSGSTQPQAAGLGADSYDQVDSSQPSLIGMGMAPSNQGVGQGGGAGQYLADSVWKAGMNYLQPQFDLQNKNLEVKMAEKGLPIGSEAWKDASNTLANQQNKGMTDLAMKAIGMVPDEQQRLWNNAKDEQNFAYNNAGNNLNLLGAMNNLLPQSGPVQQLQAPDVMGAYKNQYDAQMANYMAKQQGWQNALKLGVGLATAPWTGGVTAAGATMPGLSNSLLGMGLTKLFNGT